MLVAEPIPRSSNVLLYLAMTTDDLLSRGRSASSPTPTRSACRSRPSCAGTLRSCRGSVAKEVVYVGRRLNARLVAGTLHLHGGDRASWPSFDRANNVAAVIDSSTFGGLAGEHETYFKKVSFEGIKPSMPDHVSGCVELDRPRYFYSSLAMLLDDGENFPGFPNGCFPRSAGGSEALDIRRSHFMGDAVGHHAVVEGDPGHLELAPPWRGGHLPWNPPL